MDDIATAARRGPFESGPIARSGPIESGERDAFHDNQPPLEERIVMDFMEDLERPGEMGAPSISARIAELLASAGRAPAECDSESIAGAMADLCKQGREVAQRLEAARDKHNRPLLNAQRALKGRADGLIAPLNDAMAKMRSLLDDFARKEAARREAERRREEEARRIAEEAAKRELEAKGLADAIPEDRPLVAPPAPPPSAPLARGNYGSKLGTQKFYRHKILSVRQLPDRYLNHPRVIEALDKVIAQEIKSSGGKITIRGVEIIEDTRAAVR